MENKDTASCPFCKSIIVCWNWVCVYDEWTHECWDCEYCHTTDHKVKTGVPYKVLEILKKNQKAGLPVIYTKVMRLLYEK